MRIGLGTDLHRLVEGRPCILGGIELDHDAGPAGHSDGDAVLHAVTDAVLGGAGLDDIGTLFPDTDEKWRGADSADLLREAIRRVREKGLSVASLDIVIQTEGPRISPVRDRMRTRIAELCGADKDTVNVKGKTFEGIGEMAGGHAVAVQAVCLLAPAE